MSVSDSLAWIKHRPVGVRDTHQTSVGRWTHFRSWSGALPGNTKMKQAARPPIMEMTRPMSGMKSARTSVTTNHTKVCRTRLRFSRRTHTSTCSPWKRSHSPSMTALEGSDGESVTRWLDPRLIPRCLIKSQSVINRLEGNCQQVLIVGQRGADSIFHMFLILEGL